MTLEVRRLGPGDVDGYMELRREALELERLAFGASPEQDVGLDRGFLERAFEDPWQTAFGAFDPHLVGTVSVVAEQRRKEAHKAHVYAFYVTPSRRGKGTGRALIEAAIAHARGRDGIERVDLSVTENSRAARALYEALGFVTWGIEPDALREGDRSVAQHHMILDLGGGA